MGVKCYMENIIIVLINILVLTPVIILSATCSFIFIFIKFMINHSDERFIEVLSLIKADFKGYCLSFTKQFLLLSWKIFQFLFLISLLISLIIHFIDPTFRFNLKG